MSLHVVRLGTERLPAEGLRIGTVRRPPRGVPKAEYASRNLYDVWFPNLAPSETLLKAYFPITDAADWKRFERAYRAEMKQPHPRRDIDLLAALSHHTQLSVGCYCETLARCHRSVLALLLERAGANMGNIG